MKACKNCKYYSYGFYSDHIEAYNADLCGRDIKTEPDYINGKNIYIVNNMPCKTERGDINGCGPDALYFKKAGKLPDFKALWINNKEWIFAILIILLPALIFSYFKYYLTTVSK